MKEKIKKFIKLKRIALTVFIGIMLLIVVSAILSEPSPEEGISSRLPASTYEGLEEEQSQPESKGESQEPKSESLPTEPPSESKPEPEPEPELKSEPESELSLPTEEIICSYNTYNCSDFTTFSEAQIVFEFCGGINNDVHYLDGDNDGIACESLISSPEPEPKPTAPSSSIICSYNAYNCSNFSTHAEAQTVFEYCGAGDIHRLDRDKDGIACESLP